MRSQPRTKRDRDITLQRIIESANSIEEEFRKLKDKTVILFADLVNSTLYKQTHTFFAGLARTRYHNMTVDDIVKKDFQGEVVKYIGDGVLCRWDVGKTGVNAYKALNAAIRIQEKFDEYNRGREGLEKLESRIGISVGKVANFYRNDPQGPDVDLAARIQALAKPGQILVHKHITTIANLHRVVSSKWKGSDCVGEATPRYLKGFPEPQEVAEIRWKDHFDGIDGVREPVDEWEDYHYKATLFPANQLAHGVKVLDASSFGITLELEYKRILRKTRFPFVCVDKTEDFDAAMRDSSLFFRYLLPPHGLLDVPTKELFKVCFPKVHDMDLQEIPAEPESNSYVCARTFADPRLEQFIGKPVRLYYRIDTIISKKGHFFYLMTDNPVKDFTLTFDIANVRMGIQWIHPIGYFGTTKAPTFVYLPNPEHPTSISVHVNELIPAHAGAVFVWGLEEPEPDRLFVPR